MLKFPTIELSLKIEKPEGYKPIYFSSVKSLEPILEDEKFKVVENFNIIYVAQDGELIGAQNIARGTVDRALVDPKSVLQGPINKNISRILLTHNHPSGSSTDPSFEDIDITRDIIRAANLHNIEIVDHLIVAQGQNTYSFKNRLPEIWQ